MKTDGSNLPLKQDGRPVFNPPGDYESMVERLKGTQGSNSVDHYGLSLSGLEPRSSSPQSSERPASLMRELRVEKYKDPVLDMTEIPNDKDISRRGLWPHLYQLSGGIKFKGGAADPLLRAKDKLMGSVKETSRKEDVNSWHFRQLKSNHTDERGRVCIDAMDGNIPNSESALLPQDARMKILSKSSFSQFFGKKTPKGKGVMHGDVEDKTQHDNGGTCQSDGKSSSFVGMGPDVQVKLLQRRSVVELNLNCDGINLREWLKLGNFMKYKVERLQVFCQIAELVSLAHSQGIVLQHLRPSFFILTPSNQLKYIGSSSRTDVDIPVPLARGKKRPPEEDIKALRNFNVKQPKLVTDVKFQNPSPTTSIGGSRSLTFQDTNHDIGCSYSSDNTENRVLSMSSCQTTVLEKSLVSNLQLEEKWYACPECPDGNVTKPSSNIYSLGVLLFELLCSSDSLAHSAAMFDMHHRILPPFILSESPKEAGFCLWLIHPDPSSRPTIREILLSDLFQGFRESQSTDNSTVTGNDDEMGESEILLDFIVSSKEKKEAHAVKLIQDIRCIEADIKGLEAKTSSSPSQAHAKRDSSLQGFIKTVSRSGRNEARLITEMSQLEKAYFSMRSQTTTTTADGRGDKDLLKNRESSSQVQTQSELVGLKQKSANGLDSFFEGLCKFTCFSKFELRGTLRNGDLLNSPNVICSLSFDRDEEYIAVAGASKTIKIFEFASLLNDSINIHYPVIEVGNKSKLSCVSWNSYIKNYMASTDYDGVVQVWDASTGVGFSQHMEHQKRAWSVDFSRIDPTKFATGSDDCSVKLWCTNEKRSTSTIWSPANVCCVQYSPYSSHLLAFGSADHKIYGYDLRYTRNPWCTLAGHEKTVSYVKFVDSETLVSASTDNTLKLWDLSKTNMSGISADACRLTFTGHSNKKHFVGLSAQDGYIACGSESNEVFTYYRSLPMPITSYKFSPVGPISQHDAGDDSGQFVSSVCWRSKSNMVLAANSGGSIRLLQMV
ncbi:protein SUPPRESSOR OF PHYA-105 1-like [Silene latifolia]|uniref:protein SUPPRESSOR OF PHYA-105 1-like n=1 Tax=Silene latifolia TaxID=37657 RepID=UPI003D783FEF